MTIQISISAHSDSQEGEARMMDAIREAVSKMATEGTVYGATASTQHHGPSVDLAEGNKATTPEQPVIG